VVRHSRQPKKNRLETKIWKMVEKGDVKGLLRMLRSQKSAQVEIIEALGKIGDERAIPPLANLCQWYETRSLVKPIFLPHHALDNILSRVDKEKTLPVLIDYLENELKRKTLGHHNTYAIKLLGKIGDPRAIEILGKILNSWQLVKNKEKLAHTRTARKTAAEALGEIGDESACGHLEKALESKDVKQYPWNKTVDGRQIIDDAEISVHGVVREAMRKICR